MTVKRKYLLPLFLIFQIIFIKIIALFPNAVEVYYSNGLYSIISKIERIVFGKIPFSVGDILYSILIIYILYSLWKTRKTWKYNWNNNLLKIAGGISIFYFLFYSLWGANYYRVPVFEKMRIARDYTEEDLYNFTAKLIAKTNEIQEKITHNPTQKVINPYKQETIFKMSQNGYSHLYDQYSFFKYQIPSRKKSLYSLPLTYMGFGGYLNPFTNEAQVNYKLPMFNFPNVVCHEMAHQIGYASESECNFIGFLACINNDDLYFQYACCTVALRYCLENVYLKNEEQFKLFKSTLNSGILENFKESELFWRQYDTIIDKGFHAFYNQFLKINQQKDGIESYSKYVNLLINYYKGKEIK